MVSKRFLNGLSALITAGKSHGSFFSNTRLPSRSTIPQNKLLLCRSIPAINFVVIMFPFGSLFFFTRTTTFYRKETFLCHFALNVYQSMVLTYWTPACPKAWSSPQFLGSRQ